jgi:hypothetical protein
MKRVYFIVWIIIASVRVLPAQVQLPDLFVYEYAMTPRDPFISPDARMTLLTEDHIIRGIVSGDVVKQYLAKIVQLIKEKLYVGGVSIGDTPVESMVLINGIGFHFGDKIPLEISRKEVQGMQQLTASYGLPLTTDESGSLVLQVGRITENGVDLVLPGLKAAIYQLPLPRDAPTTAIQLEKKKRKPKN